jgi:hypothetical protein
MAIETWTHKIIWRTHKDEKTCPTCMALDGYTWSVAIGQPYPKQFIHPLFGAVFDNRPTRNCSLVKEAKGHICRCILEHHFENAESNQEQATPETPPTPNQ